jgi:hypothetical protein
MIKIMASSIGNNTASTIVNTDTLQLISKANEIIESCKNNSNCQIPSDTSNVITKSLSETAQAQASNTLRTLSIPTSSILGRNIFNRYLDLAAAVSSTYINQCGSTIVNSIPCVTNSTSVQNAQDNLRSSLSQPATDDTTNIIVMSILLSIAVVAFILFMVFLMIGLIGVAAIDTPVIPESTKITTQEIQVINPTDVQVAVPASPFIQ